MRGLCRETELSAGHLIYPLFVHDGATDEAIDSMPGCKRWSLDGLVKEAGEAHALGVNAVVLFPAVAEGLKTPGGEECFNDDMPEGCAYMHAVIRGIFDLAVH